jgi:asparagine synthase (glutamine-hydrolysing)
MCGILGFVGTPWKPHAALALRALHSRGPDASKLFERGDVVLGHARLAVIDLVDGHQPMSTQDGRYTIVFNGEIYNYRELRRELEQAGIIFLTHSDTEVLLQAYVHWGKSMLSRLDGMFAFAVWDAQEKVLFAARDVLGIKPFMYAQHADGLMLASTLAAFLAVPGFPRQIDAEALRDYLAFQTPLCPHTFCSAVRQLPPAHYLVYEQATKRLEVTAYWHIPQASDTRGISFQQAVEQTDVALQESIRRQLVADVPVGAFLSGGVDSSLMVYYMAQQVSRPLETFSLKFASREFDETPFAREVAAHFGCTHHELDAPNIDAGRLERAISDLDQPLADPAYVMTHTLSELTRQHVTVAISGDGGDELFAGYSRFFTTEDQYPERAWQSGLQRLLDWGLLPGSLQRKTLSGQEMLLYQRGELGKWKHGRKNMRHYLAPEWIRAANVEDTLGLWSAQIRQLGGRMDTSTLMRADLWTYLSENCLVKTDRASMAYGLEVRVPMLGKPVVDLALSLPASVHLQGGTKPVLQEIARKHLPELVWNRPKHGFSVPLLELFQGAWRERCEDVIRRASDLAPGLNASAIKTLWESALQGRGSRRLAYTFVVLLLWLDEHPLEWK